MVDIEKLALTLPEKKRATLAANLLESLPGVLSDEDESIAEALRRDAELEANPDRAISLAQLETQIKSRRGCCVWNSTNRLPRKSPATSITGDYYKSVAGPELADEFYAELQCYCLYRFYFYSYDCGEPRHKLADRENCSAKFWLDPGARPSKISIWPERIAQHPAYAWEHGT
jgi:hypothetical protein